MSPAGKNRPLTLRRIARFEGISLRDLMTTIAPVVVFTAAAIAAAGWFVRPAPPDAITIAGGPDPGGRGPERRAAYPGGEAGAGAVPLAFADPVYVLRDHIAFVRDRYRNRTDPS